MAESDIRIRNDNVVCIPITATRFVLKISGDVASNVFLEILDQGNRILASRMFTIPEEPITSPFIVSDEVNLVNTPTLP